MASVMEYSGANVTAWFVADDSCLSALADFRREDPITVQASSPIESALRDMHRWSVHALLVTREATDDLKQRVVGLITYYDIERWQPHRFPQSSARSDRADSRVEDVMTPWDELPLVHYESLQSLSVSDVYAMFQGTGLTHLLVVESQTHETCTRGLISRATITRRLREANGARAR